jgi:hypothetical protein
VSERSVLFNCSVHPSAVSCSAETADKGMKDKAQSLSTADKLFHSVRDDVAGTVVVGCEDFTLTPKASYKESSIPNGISPSKLFIE